MTENQPYARYALTREMLETPGLLAKYRLPDLSEIRAVIERRGRVMFTGEGSSRIFPAKNAIYRARRSGTTLATATDGARQAAEYPLSDYVVIAASNSGATKEVAQLARKLNQEGHGAFYGVTAHPDSPLANAAAHAFVLDCGAEEAVAATKSVAEQALLYQVLLDSSIVDPPEEPRELSAAVDTVLRMQLPESIVERVCTAGTIYFAGRNDGVAEELTLKTNEITRKKSDFLEGTYAVHGIEEVMDSGDVVIWIDPYPEEVAKFREVLAAGVGLELIAIATAEIDLPAIRVPSAGVFDGFVQLAAGWNLLVEVGLRLGVDLDHAVRARKVGNAL